MVTGYAAESSGLRVQKFPDVVDVRVHVRSESRFDLDVTISSPCDMPQRYNEIGIHIGRFVQGSF